MKREEIHEGQLLHIVDVHGKKRLFYVESLCGRGIIAGKRVNKDFKFNKYDKDNKKYICDEDAVGIVDPVPAAFIEALRTLHFWVDVVLPDFGVIVNRRNKIMLRAVKFQNGSYGIIQNVMYRDMSGIDPSYEYCNLFEDLSYEELVKKWEIKKIVWDLNG